MSKVDALLDRRTQPTDLPEPAERKRLREQYGVSQAQVAAALDVTRGAVAGWESGRWDPKGDTRDKYRYMLNEMRKRLEAEGTGDD